MTQEEQAVKKEQKKQEAQEGKKTQAAPNERKCGKDAPKAQKAPKAPKAKLRLMGFYQLPGELPQQVEFAELFDTSFMRRFTRYRSFDRFLVGGKFDIRSQEDFEALPEEEMDAHVRHTTKFRSWKEMIDTATDIYARRHR